MGAAFLAAEIYGGGLSPLWFFGIAAGAVVVSLILETIIPYRADWTTMGDPSLVRDLGHTFVSSAFGERLGFVLATPLFAVAGYTFAPEADQIWGSIWPHHWPMAVQLGIAIMIAEGLDYWRHRLEHEIGFLWPLHFVHHSASRLNTIKSSRNNVADMAARFVVAYMPLLLLGAPAEFILWHGAVVTMLGIPAHANMDARIPTFLHRLILTPQVHRIHHMADPIKGNSNYANVTPLFDQLFGTYTPPTEADRKVPAGVTDNPLPTNFWAEAFAPLLWPFYRDSVPHVARNDRHNSE